MIWKVEVGIEVDLKIFRSKNPILLYLRNQYSWIFHSLVMDWFWDGIQIFGKEDWMVWQNFHSYVCKRWIRIRSVCSITSLPSPCLFTSVYLSSVFTPNSPSSSSYFPLSIFEIFSISNTYQLFFTDTDDRELIRRVILRFLNSHSFLTVLVAVFRTIFYRIFFLEK